MKKVDLIFVLAIAFALFLLVCASGVASATTIYVLDNYSSSGECCKCWRFDYSEGWDLECEYEQKFNDLL